MKRFLTVLLALGIIVPTATALYLWHTNEILKVTAEETKKILGDSITDVHQEVLTLRSEKLVTSLEDNQEKQSDIKQYTHILDLYYRLRESRDQLVNSLEELQNEFHLYHQVPAVPALNEFRYNKWFLRHQLRFDSSEIALRNQYVDECLRVMLPVYQASEDPKFKIIYDSLKSAQVLCLHQADTLIHQGPLRILALGTTEDVDPNSWNYRGGVVGLYQDDINMITLKRSDSFSDPLRAMIAYHEGEHFLLRNSPGSILQEHYQIIQTELRIANILSQGAWDDLVDQHVHQSIVHYGDTLNLGMDTTQLIIHTKKAIPILQKEWTKGGATQVWFTKDPLGQRLYATLPRLLRCDSLYAGFYTCFIPIHQGETYLASPCTFSLFEQGETSLMQKIKAIFKIPKDQILTDEETGQWHNLFIIATGLKYLEQNHASDTQKFHFFKNVYINAV